ncbi:MAG: hypothetical protein L0Y57_02560 [Beijerinckiaceae bacterium]|nr:hypothetical protein [Beijerinckiaceae bacterium]
MRYQSFKNCPLAIWELLAAAALAILAVGVLSTAGSKVADVSPPGAALAPPEIPLLAANPGIPRQAAFLP